MQIKLSKYLKTFIPFTIGLFCIIYSYTTLNQKDIDSIIVSFANAKYVWIVLGVFFGVLSHISRSYRWKFLLEPLGYKITFLNSIMAIFSAYLINYTAPRAGDIARGTIAYKYEKIPFEKAVGTIVAERAVDLLCFIILIIIGLILKYDQLIICVNKIFTNKDASIDANNYSNTNYLIIIFVTVFLVMFFVLKKSNIFVKVKLFLKGRSEGFMIIFKLKNKWNFIFHSIFIWVMYVLMFYVASKGINGLPELDFSIILISFILSSLTLILTPGGIGSYPLAIQASLGCFAIGDVSSLSFGWIMWSSQTLMIIIFGGISLLLLPIYNKQRNKTN